jgi:hypothetical protein
MKTSALIRDVTTAVAALVLALAAATWLLSLRTTDNAPVGGFGEGVFVPATDPGAQPGSGRPAGRHPGIRHGAIRHGGFRHGGIRHGGLRHGGSGRP